MSKNPCGDILKAQLETLKSRDRKMSLRKFAIMLNVPVSSLSQVISGSRKLGVRTALRISQNLGFDEHLHQLFMNAVLENYVKMPRLNKLEEVAPRALPPRGTWKHHAVLELGSLPGAHMEPYWISRRLNLTIAEVTDVLRDLKEWGRLGENQDVLQKEPSGEIFINNDTRRSKTFHAALLAKADQSLDWFKGVERDLSSVILAVEKSQIRHVIKKIREFQASMMKYLRSDKSDEVYVLQVNLFPLSNWKGDQQAP